MGRPEDVFIREGLAMHFDQNWKGIPNGIWTNFYYRNSIVQSLTAFMENQAFFAENHQVTYPISGALCSYLIGVYGIDTFRTAFAMQGTGLEKRLRAAYGRSPQQLEADLKAYLQCIGYTEAFDNIIAERLPNIGKR
jgi:hypothetical protein